MSMVMTVLLLRRTYDLTPKRVLPARAEIMSKCRFSAHSRLKSRSRGTGDSHDEQVQLICEYAKRRALMENPMASLHVKVLEPICG